jgi:hypothetical protein
MSIDLQQLTPQTAVHPTATPTQRTRREERWARRRRRMWFEEAMGWVLVPLIVLACYWLLDTALNALGTSIPAVVSGLKEIASAL